MKKQSLSAYLVLFFILILAAPAQAQYANVQARARIAKAQADGRALASSRPKGVVDTVINILEQIVTTTDELVGQASDPPAALSDTARIEGLTKAVTNIAGDGDPVLQEDLGLLLTDAKSANALALQMVNQCTGDVPDGTSCDDVSNCSMDSSGTPSCCCFLGAITGAGACPGSGLCVPSCPPPGCLCGPGCIP